MEDETADVTAAENPTSSLSGPVEGFVPTIHAPKRESVGEAGAEYLEGLEKGYIGERTDEAPDDSGYQAPTLGEAEPAEVSGETIEPERDAQLDADEAESETPAADEDAASE